MPKFSKSQYVVKVTFQNGFSSWANRFTSLYIHTEENLMRAKKFQSRAVAADFINMCTTARPESELTICKIVSTVENV